MATFGDAFDHNKGKEDDFYVVLGCDESSSLEQITKEYHVRAKLYHPDRLKGDVDDKGKEMFRKINKAYEILSNEDTRKCYDSWRRVGLDMPFDNWLALQSRFKSSLHFKNTKSKQLAIDSDAPQTSFSFSKEDFRNPGQSSSFSSSERSSLLDQFRAYKI